MAKNDDNRVQKGTARHCRVAPCKCEHPFQDSTYGSGNRVFNPTFKKTHRCTVCLRVSSEQG